MLFEDDATIKRSRRNKFKFYHTALVSRQYIISQVLAWLGRKETLEKKPKKEYFKEY